MAIEEPRISWRGNTPISNISGDIYYNPDSGLDETGYVFIKGNGLPERWRALPGGKEVVGEHFTILETGFGTGLNFVAAASVFLENVPPSTGLRLHFVSIEKYPLKKDDVARALSAFTSLRETAGALLDVYPPRTTGLHRLELFGGRVVLTLVLDDILAALRSLVVPRGVDAFFLDGFNPAENPGMWSDDVFAGLAALAREGSTLATFTAAGHVRRGLEKAGFTVRKIAGYGKKREMITAEYTGRPAEDKLPWFGHMTFHNKFQNNYKDSIVVGAGLAGCAVAASLLSRGWDVTLIEESDKICSGASGNPLGVFFPVAHRKPTLTDRLSHQAYLLALRRLRGCMGEGFEPAGLLQILEAEEGASRFGKWAEGHGSLEAVFRHGFDGFEARPGMSLEFFPDAGFVSPSVFAARLLESSLALPGAGRLRFLPGTRVSGLRRTDAPGIRAWEILGVTGQVIQSSPCVILANSFGISEFSQTSWFPLRKTRGQLVWTRETMPPGFTCPVSSGVYAIPGKDLTLVGATHDFSDDPLVSPQQSLELLREAAEISTDEKWAAFFHRAVKNLENAAEESAGWEARVAFRSVAVDHFPVIGRVPDRENYLASFSDLAHGAQNYIRKNGSKQRPEAWHENLYCLSGLGSRGIIYSQIGAGIIASMVCGEPLPVEQDIADALSPARFLYRQIRNGR